MPTTVPTRCAFSTGVITTGLPDILYNQFNPDVTVRRRGIMEKCTFCIQRIHRAKIAPKAEGREMLDGEVNPPVRRPARRDAIVLAAWMIPRAGQPKCRSRDLRIQLLEDLGTLPRVTYLPEERLQWL